MKIYHYHPECKYYLGYSDADESPLEPGVFLIPAYATDIKPPECLPSEIQVFSETSWEVRENLCGIYYSTISGEQIENINPLSLPENTTKEKPPEVPEGFKLEWNNKWEIEEIPSLTPQQKLEAAGLTVEELKSLLGLTP
jgi:hypothetical protein